MKLTLLSYMACIAGLMALTRCSSPMAAQKTAPSGGETTGALLGVQPRAAFGQLPYQHWFDSIYQAYTVHAEGASRIGKLWKQEKVDIFLGTWCGDSRREVPRMLKVLDRAGIPAGNVRLICVKSGAPGHKTSPGREEQGLYIFRVPTFIVRRGNAEAGRIVESPVESLEKDLAKILGGEAYQPRYAAGDSLRGLFATRSPETINSRLPELAASLKPLVSQESELFSFGYVLLTAGDYARAITAFRLNTILFPEKATTWQWLAEGYRRNHDHEQAILAYQRTLELSPAEASAGRLPDSLRSL